MDFHGGINMRDNKMSNMVMAIDTNFPATPQPGRLVFKDRILYICTAVEDDLPVWVPMTQTLQMHKHLQLTNALEWTVSHGLNTGSVFVQVYDEDGKWVIPDSINTSVFNQVTVGFSTPIKGHAVVMRGSTEGSPQPLVAYEQSFNNLDTWVVSHGLGYNPIIRVIIGNNEVQPQNITYDNTMQATLTFASPKTGSVRCI